MVDDANNLIENAELDHAELIKECEEIAESRRQRRANGNLAEPSILSGIEPDSVFAEDAAVDKELNKGDAEQVGAFESGTEIDACGAARFEDNDKEVTLVTEEYASEEDGELVIDTNRLEAFIETAVVSTRGLSTERVLALMTSFRRHIYNRKHEWEKAELLSDLEKALKEAF